MEEQPQTKRIKIYAGIFIAIFVLAATATYFVATETFFRAEVLEYLGSGPEAKGDYFIAEYVAAPGSVGEIEVIANTSDVMLNGCYAKPCG